MVKKRRMRGMFKALDMMSKSDNYFNLTKHPHLRKENEDGSVCMVMVKFPSEVAKYEAEGYELESQDRYFNERTEEDVFGNAVCLYDGKEKLEENKKLIFIKEAKGLYFKFEGVLVRSKKNYARLRGILTVNKEFFNKYQGIFFCYFRDEYKGCENLQWVVDDEDSDLFHTDINFVFTKYGRLFKRKKTTDEIFMYFEFKDNNVEEDF